MTDEIRFDYDTQAWIKNGVYVKCGHVDQCGCYGKAHEGERATTRVQDDIQAPRRKMASLDYRGHTTRAQDEAQAT